jgi:hypothetical protein
MTATLVVRHQVNDYDQWRTVYESLESLRAGHGCTGARVWTLAADRNDVLVTHDFPTPEQATSFAHDPALADGMARAGVAGPPQIDVFAVA